MQITTKKFWTVFLVIMIGLICIGNATDNKSDDNILVSANDTENQSFIENYSNYKENIDQNYSLTNDSPIVEIFSSSDLSANQENKNDSILTPPTSSKISYLDNSLKEKPADETSLASKSRKSVNDRKNYKKNADATIADIERKLSNHLLIQNDSIDITAVFHGFAASRETGSRSSPSIKMNVDVNTGQSVPPSDIDIVQKGGFIQHGHDGKTRVFSPDGMELSYTVDNRIEQIQTSSGETVPATYLIAVPSESSIDSIGSHTYVTYKGEVLLTVVDDDKNVNSDNYEPATKGTSWIESANASSPSSPIGEFSADWVIPHSPILNDNLDQNGNPTTPPNAYNSKINLLFNGIQPTDGSLIVQPVTAYNYRANCQEYTGGTYRFHDDYPRHSCESEFLFPGDSKRFIRYILFHHD